MANTENSSNNNLLFGVIIGLLIIIAVLAFFVGKNINSSSIPNNTTQNTTQTNLTGEDIIVTVIDDKRCFTCGTSEILWQIKQAPFLAQAEFIEQDFSDPGVQEYMKENSITTLPAIIFNTNNIWDWGTMAPFLSPLSTEWYTLQVGASFDPFITRSEKGFLTLDTEIISEISSNGHIKGNPDAKITWIEYSDMECPFCARLHNAGTIEEVFEKYGDDINMIFQHFPLDFHSNAKPAAEVLECLGEQKWSDAFYALIKTAFKEETSKKSFMIDEAVKLWADKILLEACVDEGKFSQKIDSQLKTWQTNFGITGTPWNVIVHNITWEYEVIPWAYGVDKFSVAIDELLQ